MVKIGDAALLSASPPDAEAGLRERSNVSNIMPASMPQSYNVDDGCCYAFNDGLMFHHQLSLGLTKSYFSPHLARPPQLLLPMLPRTHDGINAQAHASSICFLISAHRR